MNRRNFLWITIALSMVVTVLALYMFFYRAANTLYSDGTRLDIPHKYFEDDADFFAALKSLPGLDQS
ncbi:hypothetical protein, partial [Sapientia aquatica]|uniref:hypothetical protein n=1 Tax=Sapientia aquatica TaxID=1549640 RepID=UPI00197DCA78